jgi:WD40 repeat protein/tetratricopeptide (TPR) repeat protein
MISRSYINFDLSIERDGDTYRAHVLQSCAGEGNVEFSLPFSTVELENFTLKIGHSRRGVGRKARGSDSPELSAAKEFGARLFAAVFQGDVYACLRTSMDKARAQGVGLRFLLRLPPELINLPWEYLYNPAWNQFFALSTSTPVVRYLELTPAIHPLSINLPLRVLVVISSPTDYQPLDVEREWRNLQDALQPLVARGLVEIERLNSTSLLALQHQLRRNEYHIFHFIGHGVFDERAQDGLLLFTDEQGRGRPLSGQYLGMLLRDHSSLRLAVLNACEGARTGNDDPFAGAAHSLVQMGLPAVIAMQFEISDSAAILFAQEFYTAMADGYPVDAALTDARKAIFANNNSVEWGTPVLFSRILDGWIFDLPVMSAPIGPVPPLPVRPHLPAGSTHEISDRIPPTAVVLLYEDGLSAFQLEDWDRAREKFQAVLKARPGYRDAAERLVQIQTQIDLAQVYRQGLELLESSDRAEGIAILERLVAEVPDYRDAAQRLEQAREQINGLSDLYRDALQAMDGRRWSEAQRLLGQIRKIQPEYRDSARLMGKVEVESARRARKLASRLRKRGSIAILVILILIGLAGMIFVMTPGLGMGIGAPGDQATTTPVTPLTGETSSSTLTPSPSAATQPAILTPTVTPMITRTVTASPAGPTATAMPRSTLILPVSVGTPVPVPLSKILPENVGGLTQYALWCTQKLYPWSDDLAVSPDGKLIAIASADGWVLYDAQTFGEVRRIKNENKYPKIAFSPDGQTLAIGSYNEDVTHGLVNYPIRLWQVSTGSLLAKWDQLETINRLVFSPDGKILALAMEKSTIKLLRVADGKVINTIRDRGEIVGSVAFSPDGQILASASYTEKSGSNAAGDQIGSAEKVTVRFWNVADGSLIYTFADYHTTRVGYLSFSPDGRILASGAADSVVRLWNVAEPKPLSVLVGQTSVSGVVFSPNGKVLAASSANDIRIWRVMDGNLLSTLKTTPRGVRFLTFVNDSLLLAALDDGTIQVWGIK